MFKKQQSPYLTSTFQAENHFKIFKTRIKNFSEFKIQDWVF